MQYLRHFPAALRPALDAIVLKAQVDCHPGSLGGSWARQCGLRFVVQTYFGCAAVACDAVRDGKLPYPSLNSCLEHFQRELVSSVYDQLVPLSQQSGTDYEQFKSQAAENIRTASEWRSLQEQRINLAHSATERIGDTLAQDAGQDGVEKYLAESVEALERSRALDRTLSEVRRRFPLTNTAVKPLSGRPAADQVTPTRLPEAVPDVAPTTIEEHQTKNQADPQRRDSPGASSNAAPAFLTSALSAPQAQSRSTAAEPATEASAPIPQSASSPANGKQVGLDEPSQDDPMYSVQRAAELLGVSVDTIYRMQKRGDIRSVRIGRLRRIAKSEIGRLCDTGEYPKQ